MGRRNDRKPVRQFDVIVIGASWGGMEAIISLLKDIPKLYPIPIIVVIHRQKNTISSLCDILRKYVAIPLKEIDEKEKILNNTIYIAPANYHVLIEKDLSFALDVSEHVLYSRPSIDVLFESAAIIYGKRVLGILLTGANSDGSEGLKTIAEHGGTTIVQNPEEALVRTMPMAALGKAKIDYIFTLKEIQKYLLEIV